MALILTADSGGTVAVSSVSKSNGGFGQDISTGLTNDQVAITAGNAITIGALTVNAIPANIPATKIGTGSVDNTEFGYLDGLTGAIQTQINTKVGTTDSRLPPTPTGAGKILYDTGTAYAETSAGTASQVFIGGTTPVFGNVPFAAIPVGTSGSTVAVGNDTRLNPIPSAAGNIIYDTGTGYAALATGTATFHLQSNGPGLAPSWVSAAGVNAGSAVVLASLGRAATWTANNYAGPFGITEASFAGSGSTTFPLPWPAPCAGTLKNLQVQLFNTVGLGGAGFTVYTATVAAPFTYTATTLATSLSLGQYTGFDRTHSVAVAAGDLFIVRCNQTLSNAGAVITAQFEPTSA